MERCWHNSPRRPRQGERGNDMNNTIEDLENRCDALEDRVDCLEELKGSSHNIIESERDVLKRENTLLIKMLKEMNKNKNNNQKENAALKASKDDLFKALKNLLEKNEKHSRAVMGFIGNKYDGGPKTHKDARAALARAKGETE